MFDVFFISHGEANADENWQNLTRLCSRAQRIDGIDGLYEVHRACAEQSSTENFFVVDADAWVYDDFDFDPASTAQPDAVMIWHAKNPVNGLEYGYGGVKLFPRQPFLENRSWNTDLSTTIGAAVAINETLSCETRFNATPESAWIGGFRECAKLASLRSITTRVDKNIRAQQQQLDQCVLEVGKKDWTTEQKRNQIRAQQILIEENHKPTSIYDLWPEIQQATWRYTAWTRLGWFKHNGEHAVMGARAGLAYGLGHASDDTAMSYINDWSWLRQQYQEYHG